MTDREKILAEIERLKANYVPKVNEEYRGFAEHLLDIIIDDINSLPVKYQSEDLDVEINLKYKSNNALMMPIGDFRELILHFTDWQKSRVINEACEWLQKHINDYLVHGRDIDFLYDDFKKAMEKED